MHLWKAFLFCGLFSLWPLAAEAQWEVEGDPTVYVLKGYSAHIAHTIFDGKSRLQFGAFGAETPEWVHGNEGWTENSRGVTLKLDYFPLQRLPGLFVGIDSNYARVRYSLQDTGARTDQNIVGFGPRIGYRFDLGQHLYSTWISLDYQFGAKDVILTGKRFAQTRLSLFPAVHVGWRF